MTCTAASSALGAGAVDADVLPDQVLLVVRAEALVLVDQATGAGAPTSPPTSSVSASRPRVGVRLGLLLGDALVQRLADAPPRSGVLP